VASDKWRLRNLEIASDALYFALARRVTARPSHDLFRAMARVAAVGGLFIHEPRSSDNGVHHCVRIIVTLYWSARYAEARSRAKSGGRGKPSFEPASLHPNTIPQNAWLRLVACPEGGFWGIIDGRAELIEPSRCIGHGACTGVSLRAITPVFGTEQRGSRHSRCRPDFKQTWLNLHCRELRHAVSRNAIEQGAVAIACIRKLTPRSAKLRCDYCGRRTRRVFGEPRGHQSTGSYLTVEQTAFMVRSRISAAFVMTTPQRRSGRRPSSNRRKERPLTTWANIANKIAL
jgi:hypothetical protein